MGRKKTQTFGKKAGLSFEQDELDEANKLTVYDRLYGAIVDWKNLLHNGATDINSNKPYIGSKFMTDTNTEQVLSLHSYALKVFLNHFSKYPEDMTPALIKSTLLGVERSHNATSPNSANSSNSSEDGNEASKSHMWKKVWFHVWKMFLDGDLDSIANFQTFATAFSKQEDFKCHSWGATTINLSTDDLYFFRQKIPNRKLYLSSWLMMKEPRHRIDRLCYNVNVLDVQKVINSYTFDHVVLLDLSYTNFDRSIYLQLIHFNSLTALDVTGCSIAMDQNILQFWVYAMKKKDKDEEKWKKLRILRLAYNPNLSVTTVESLLTKCDNLTFVEVDPIFVHGMSIKAKNYCGLLKPTDDFSSAWLPRIRLSQRIEAMKRDFKDYESMYKTYLSTEFMFRENSWGLGQILYTMKRFYKRLQHFERAYAEFLSKRSKSPEYQTQLKAFKIGENNYIGSASHERSTDGDNIQKVSIMVDPLYKTLKNPRTGIIHELHFAEQLQIPYLTFSKCEIVLVEPRNSSPPNSSSSSSISSGSGSGSNSSNSSFMQPKMRQRSVNLSSLLPAGFNRAKTTIGKKDIYSNIPGSKSNFSSANKDLADVDESLKKRKREPSDHDTTKDENLSKKSILFKIPRPRILVRENPHCEELLKNPVSSLWLSSKHIKTVFEPAPPEIQVIGRPVSNEAKTSSGRVYKSKRLELSGSSVTHSQPIAQDDYTYDYVKFAVKNGITPIEFFRTKK